MTSSRFSGLDSVLERLYNRIDPISIAVLGSFILKVSPVERMLALHKQSSRMPQGQEMLRREIESTDRAIDKLVYALYSLSYEEIKIVEG